VEVVDLVVLEVMQTVDLVETVVLALHQILLAVLQLAQAVVVEDHITKT
tara:strand:- start:190 stop:336 length:147 start_codon:yes stop_codon:yes gene_type:complete